MDSNGSTCCLEWQMSMIDGILFTYGGDKTTCLPILLWYGIYVYKGRLKHLVIVTFNFYHLLTRMLAKIKLIKNQI